MINDKYINISVGQSRKSTSWPVQTILWSEFLNKISRPIKTTESFAVYKSMPKTKQDDLKDVGGFVGGSIKDGGRRKNNNIIDRHIVTLDADNIEPGGAQNIINAVAGLKCAYGIYSTRKHENAKPRLRIVIPLDSAVSGEEYEPIARRLAQYINLQVFDPTTFEATRLMYWPSISADGEYIFVYEDKPWACAQGLLSTYTDWRNVSQWPEVPGALKLHTRMAAKQGDPEDKKGVVGAFCRTYDIPSAIAAFLGSEYSPVDAMPGRYTYMGGSTTGGAVLYDDGKFLYSHHMTDPCSNLLVNAFDLVRLHKFSEMDKDITLGTPTVQLPSYKAMQEYAIQDSPVAELLKKEKYESAVSDFEDTAARSDTDWMKGLQLNTAGGYLKTIDNVLLILRNDPNLKSKIAHDEFANRPVVLADIPWRKHNGRNEDMWVNADDSGLRHYIERVYSINGKERIMDAFTLCARENKFHRIKDYLKTLVWDGKLRLDNILIDYLGAANTEYTKAVARKSLCAAVARVFKPGTKFDTAPVLVGPQGIGKTTFLKKLGKEYHVEVEMSFKGKETAELIQGYWIVEMGELKGFSRAEMADIRQFMSRTEDVYREPYGLRTQSYPRQCVFFGTTNDHEFLRDITGDRRFFPIDLAITKPTKNVFGDLDEEVDQIWAEAYTRLVCGEILHLTGDVANEAAKQQEDHRETGVKDGLITDFLEKPLPLDWDKRDLSTRRLWWSGDYLNSEMQTTLRENVCAAEIWCECFNGELKFSKRTDIMEINAILAGLKSWERMSTPRKFGASYGNQRGYKRLQSQLH